MRALAVCLVLSLAVPINACVWIKGTTKHATRVRTGGLPVAHLHARLHQAIKTDLAIEGAAMERQLRGATGLDERNDYAVALMYLGRAREAIDLLKKLENEHPGDYATAANLGTACELAGQNTEAKRWIQEAIRRNPDSHSGTEWLHVKILEAKIQAEQNPDYFKNHSVLNLDYRKLETGAKIVPIGTENKDVRKIIEALEFQLSERVKFVKGKDPVVASLLFDFAALKAGTETLETAKKLLEMSLDYGYPAERINPLITRYNTIIKIAGLRTNLFITAAILLIIAFLAFSHKRRWLIISSNASPKLSAP